MRVHESYEELCAVAAAGGVSPEEWVDLRAHLDECLSCREKFDDFTELQSRLLIQHKHSAQKNGKGIESKTRRLILEQAVREGARFSDEAWAPPKATALGTEKRTLWVIPTVAAVILIAVAGLEWWGFLHLRSRMPAAPTASSQSASVTSVQSGSVISVPVTPSTRSEAVLQQITGEAAALKRQLAEARMQYAQIESAHSQDLQRIADLQQQLDASITDKQKYEQELERLKSSSAEQVSQLASAHAETVELEKKLSEVQSKLDRERELMAAGRDLRDVIAARNLHIIDVYDTDSGGSKKAFGRVFYTEGKSLVFYAYDLEEQKSSKERLAYYAWGKRTENNGRVRSLGIFYADDQSQRRWVLKVNDPQMLSEIDSVFVTLEHRDHAGPQPSGKPMLSAYLGTEANHP